MADMSEVVDFGPISNHWIWSDKKNPMVGFANLIDEH
jgi:hypothetical protein